MLLNLLHTSRLCRRNGIPYCRRASAGWSKVFSGGARLVFRHRRSHTVLLVIFGFLFFLILFIVARFLFAYYLNFTSAPNQLFVIIASSFLQTPVDYYRCNNYVARKVWFCVSAWAWRQSFIPKLFNNLGINLGLRQLFAVYVISCM